VAASSLNLARMPLPSPSTSTIACDMARHGNRMALISLGIPKLVRFHKFTRNSWYVAILYLPGCSRRVAFGCAGSNARIAPRLRPVRSVERSETHHDLHQLNGVLTGFAALNPSDAACWRVWGQARP